MINCMYFHRLRQSKKLKTVATADFSKLFLPLPRARARPCFENVVGNFFSKKMCGLAKSFATQKPHLVAKEDEDHAFKCINAARALKL